MYNQALGAVNILARVMPLVFEDAAWDGFWWTPLPVGVVLEVAVEGMFTAEGDVASMNTTPGDSTTQVPLAEALIDALLTLAFIPGFTSSHASTNEERKKYPRNMRGAEVGKGFLNWTHGVGVETASAAVDLRRDGYRLPIVRLLLVCFSKPLYSNPSDLDPAENVWLKYFVSGRSAGKAVDLTRNMLNIFIGYDPVGWGVAYGHIFSPDDNREALVGICAEMIAMLIDYKPPASVQDNDPGPVAWREGATEVAVPVAELVNAPASWFAKLTEEVDHEFILKGMVTLLNTALVGTYLPGSGKKVIVHQEIFVLFWRLCDSNPAFLSYALKSNAILDIVWHYSLVHLPFLT